MASKTFNMKFFALLISSFAIIQMAIAGDPDVLTDFIVPPNVTDVNGDFFTFTGMRARLDGFPTVFKVTKASMVEFPALNGQSVSYAVLEFLAGTTNLPHTQTLQAGDVFVFPKGLVHFQYNDDVKSPVITISTFGSANAGTVSLPNTLFTTGIDDNVLAKSFKTDIATIKALKAGLAPQP
uniref:Germin-like protein n=1 Tax=Quercus lobata TaxID=97700 RepID=A0A7N2KLY6_QUELO